MARARGSRRRGGPLSGGQILIGVLLLLVVMATIVPLMVLYTQREARWSEKESQSNIAFHLAEAGVEKGYRVLTSSTATWRNLIKSATLINDFKFDKKFSDVSGGYYTVSITSGPEKNQATVISIGKDGKAGETRALKVIYAAASQEIAIQSARGVKVGGGTVVEWGSIIGNEPLTADSRTSPQFWSASSIDLDPNGETLPNNDEKNCQWHSYSSQIPPDPGINLSSYRSSAEATTTLYTTAQSWSNYTYTGGGTVYVENNLTLDSPGIEIVGTLIVTGSLATNSGNWGKGNATVPLPREAWKQYCNNWSFYRSEYDPDAETLYATFPGLNSGYLSASTRTYTPSPDGKWAVRGFLYVGGNFSTSGGAGNSYIHGTMYVVGQSTLTANSGVTVYYSEEAAANMETTKVNIVRESWRDWVTPWPSGL